MPNPAVSAVITVSGRASRVADALASILGQSLADVEAIVATEAAFFEPDVEQAVRSGGVRVRPVILDHHGTAGSLLQAGIDAANGTYVGWIEADNTWDPRKLEWQMAAIRKAGEHAVCATPKFGPRSGSDPVGTPVSFPLADLVGGRLDPASLLVSRACLAAVGSADASLDQLSTFDLTARLSTHFPFVSVDASLVRSPEKEDCCSPDLLAERQHVFAGLLAQLAGDRAEAARRGRKEILLQIAAMMANEAPLAPRLRSELAKLVEARTLTVVTTQALGSDARAREFLSQLRVPKARYLELPSSNADWPEQARDAAARTKSEYIVLAPENFAPEFPLLAQVLQATGAELDACLPMRESLIYERPPGARSLVPWTVFRRDALLAGHAANGSGEGAFWTSLSRLGRVGALPPKPVLRPDPDSRAEKARARIVVIPALERLPDTPDAHIRALVDRDWYLSTYPDVAASGVDPVKHYLEHGWQELREPNAWFSTPWYYDRAPGVRRSRTMPLLDFVTRAAEAGRRPHPGFFPRWYAAQHPGLTDATHALLHFLTIGAKRGAVPGPALDTPEIAERIRVTPPAERSQLLRQLQSELGIDETLAPDLVDGHWYAREYPDVASAGVSPVEHYLSFGWQERRDPNAWFETSWYLDRYPEAGSWLACPLDHFAARGCRPSPGFDAAWYAAQHLPPGTHAAESLRHYLQIGWSRAAVPDPLLDTPERRARFEQCPRDQRPSRAVELRAEGEQELALRRALVDPDGYRGTYPELGLERKDAFRHFQSEGWREGRDPNFWFSTAYYLEQHPELREGDESPLDHFVRRGAAAGARPHKLFDNAWYSRHYLGLQTPSAEALRHFLLTGLAAGAVADPAIQCATIEGWLRDRPAAERSHELRRLLALAGSLAGCAGEWRVEDADLWPLLLRRRFPEQRTVALLLMVPDGTSDALVAAAEQVLPPDEHPLFCTVLRSHRVRIAEAYGPSTFALDLELPTQAEAFRLLLASSRCRRAACVGDRSQLGPAARAVRNAGVPLTEREGIPARTFAAAPP